MEIYIIMIRNGQEGERKREEEREREKNCSDMVSVGTNKRAYESLTRYNYHNFLFYNI